MKVDVVEISACYLTVAEKNKHSSGRLCSRMGAMTTVWRPRVRIAIEDIDKVEEEAKDASLTKRGRSGRGPLPQRAMRARGEAPLELQGVQRLSARSSAL